MEWTRRQWLAAARLGAGTDVHTEIGGLAQRAPRADRPVSHNLRRRVQAAAVTP